MQEKQTKKSDKADFYCCHNVHKLIRWNLLKEMVFYLIIFRLKNIIKEES